MKDNWMFGILDEETLSRVYIMGCRRCVGHVGLGQPYGMRIIEHVPRWKFWVRSARVDSYHFRCALAEIRSSIRRVNEK